MAITVEKVTKLLQEKPYTIKALRERFQCSAITAKGILKRIETPTGYERKTVPVREGKRGPASRAVTFVRAA